MIARKAGHGAVVAGGRSGPGYDLITCGAARSGVCADVCGTTADGRQSGVAYSEGAGAGAGIEGHILNGDRDGGSAEADQGADSGALGFGQGDGGGAVIGRGDSATEIGNSGLTIRAGTAGLIGAATADHGRCVIHNRHCEAAWGGVVVSRRVRCGVSHGGCANGEGLAWVVVRAQADARTIVAGGGRCPTGGLVAGEPARTSENCQAGWATANRRRLVVIYRDS